MQQKKIHPIDLYAGERLREVRKAAGISQDTLALQIDHPVTFQQIQKYERGSNRLAASKLWEFAKALNVPPAFFFPPENKEAAYCITPEEARLLHQFRNLTEEKRQALQTLLREDS